MTVITVHGWWGIQAIYLPVPPPYCRGGILVLCYSWFSSVLVLGTVCIFVHLWPSFRLGNGLGCRLYPSLVSRSGAAVSQSTLLDRRVFWSHLIAPCVVFQSSRLKMSIYLHLFYLWTVSPVHGPPSYLMMSSPLIPLFIFLVKF